MVQCNAPFSLRKIWQGTRLQNSHVELHHFVHLGYFGRSIIFAGVQIISQLGQPQLVSTAMKV